jgi:predicted  nucleic acid-binding Zn-ribbon protein
MKPLAICIAFLLLFAISAPAEKRRDALNQLEIDQLRDTAQEPLERLKLYLDFARARLQALDKARSDPKVTDRGQETHDHLQDFLDVFDELNDNVDTFADRKEDLRGALKVVIDGDSEFQSKLRALKDAAEATPAEIKAYDFLLTNAIETVDSSIEDHRQLLEEQEEAAKHKKKK